MSVRVRDLTGDWRVVWAGEGDAARRFRDLDAALRFVARWRHDPLAVTGLRSLLAQRDAASCSLRDDGVVARCAQLLAQGRLRCVRVVPIRVEDVARQESDAHDTIQLDTFLPQEEPRTWIEIQLTDMEGNPMAGERYWIQLPDGSVRQGALNEQGLAYFGDLDPGECEIRWPEMDDEAMTDRPTRLGWTPEAVRSPSTRAAARSQPRTWVEVALVDHEGQPMPGERFSLRLPDGTLREGRLDGRGRARFADIDAGDCVLRWPDLEDEAVEAVG